MWKAILFLRFYWNRHTCYLSVYVRIFYIAYRIKIVYVWVSYYRDRRDKYFARKIVENKISYSSVYWAEKQPNTIPKSKFKNNMTINHPPGAMWIPKMKNSWLRNLNKQEQKLYHNRVCRPVCSLLLFISWEYCNISLIFFILKTSSKSQSFLLKISDLWNIE